MTAQSAPLRPGNKSLGAGGAAAAAGSVDAAVIPAQKLESFTVAVPFQLHVTTIVAGR